MKNPANIAFSCVGHGPKPDPKFEKIDPFTLVGKFVKRAFPVTGHRAVKSEHMWVKVQRVDGNQLVGVLDNDPEYAVDMNCGDAVRVSLREIEAVTP